MKMTTKTPDEEKKFVKVNDPSLKHRLKHVIVKHPDRNGNGDDVFNAANIKTIDRAKERHGYNPGEDAEIYEDDSGEEAALEQTPINELSKGTLGRYIKKAADSYGQAGQRAGIRAGQARRDVVIPAFRHDATGKKRLAGIEKATDRLTKEDFEVALQEAYDSGFVGAVNHHTPEGKAKIKQIQSMVKDHNKKMRAEGKHHEQLKVAAYGRLGKNNPNAAKYSPNNEKRIAAGGNKNNRPPKISPQDASHVRIHVTKKQKNWEGKWV
jgi:hypothetical protein